MFESAELDHRLSSKEYQATVPVLREALLNAQFDLLEKKDRSVLIIVGGVEGAGKGETINLLSEWLDPRHLEVHALTSLSDEERARPEYYRHFRRLPPRGKIGVHFGSWHSTPIIQHATKQISRQAMDGALARICQFERMLTNEGWILLKLWFHLSKTQQKHRLETLSKDKKQRWRITDVDKTLFDQYDRFAKVSSRALREMSTDYAPWHIIPGADPHYRHITVGHAVLSALTADTPRHVSQNTAVRPAKPIDSLHLLNTLDMSKTISKKKYTSTLDELQGRLNLAVRHKKFRDRAVVAVFEGADAAGKGGAIRRVTSALDVRS